MYWLRYSAQFKPLLSVMQEPTSSTPTARQHTPVKLCAARCLWSTTNSLSLRKSEYQNVIKSRRDFLNEYLQGQKKKKGTATATDTFISTNRSMVCVSIFSFLVSFNIPISVEGLLRCILDEFVDAPNELA